MQDVWCPYCHESDNVIKRGKNRLGKQQYYCKECKQWFTETTNTIFHYRHFSKEEIINICMYIIEGKSLRTIATLTHHHRDTTSRLIDAIAREGHQINYLLSFTGEENNMLWSNMKKRKRNWRKESTRYKRKDERDKEETLWKIQKKYKKL